MRRSSLSIALVCAVGCGGKVVDVPPENSPWPAVDASPPPFDSAIGDTRPSDPPPSPPVLADIEVVPSNATLFIDLSKGASPATLTYKAILHRDDGTKEDVTASAVFSLDDPSVGTFAGPTFTAVSKLPLLGAPYGTVAKVRATDGTKNGLANLTLVQLDRAKDLFFVSPPHSAPSPTSQVLRATAGSEPIDLSIAPTKAGDFVKVVRAMSEGDTTKGCAPAATKDTDGDGVDDTFTTAKPGSAICFEVVAKMNTTVKGVETAKFYGITATLVGNPGAMEIEPHTFVFLVPPYSGGGVVK